MCERGGMGATEDRFILVKHPSLLQNIQDMNTSKPVELTLYYAGEKPGEVQISL